MPSIMHDAKHMTPAEARSLCRSGAWAAPTAGLCDGYAQANLVIVPERWADDFSNFCARNEQACPLLERTEPGEVEAGISAPGSDLRYDLPRYKVLIDGEVDRTVTSIEAFWRDDFVSFLLGCSFTFEHHLMDAGIPVRHIACGRNVPMFRTNRACESSGVFSGPLVVSMRPMLPKEAERASRITASMTEAHGGPVHIGDPRELGIADPHKPDYGEPVPFLPGEVCVFWACGVTPLEALRGAKLPVAVTHAPGHMFLTDRRETIDDT